MSPRHETVAGAPDGRGPRRILVSSADPALLARCRAAAERGDAWEIHACATDEEAAAELARSAFDVVIQDAGRSHAGGWTVLRQVRRDLPRASRILVTEERCALGWTCCVAHQVLPTSFTAGELVRAIARIERLQRAIAATRAAMGGRLDALRWSSPALRALAEARSRPTAPETDEMVAIVESDRQLSVRVLQLINGAYFGRSRQIASVRQATSLLGCVLLDSFVIMGSLLGALEAAPPRGFSLDVFADYSVQVARLAERFVRERGLGEKAFAAGLLHDVGKLVLALEWPREFAVVVAQVGCTGAPQAAVESEILGLDHGQLGAALLSAWGMPIAVVEAVAFHHARPAPVDPGLVLAAVHAADALAGIVLCGDPDARLDRALLGQAGMLGELERWRAWTEELLAGPTDR